ncbi:tyrosine-type recombinase/integrase [Streptomyces sp. MMS24-I2-30]|uniref:tyrosine-type recombinase/integrase n=1 Tax=Streptomyces sp. MMS24-I2-30 TaxID=3351564 RepID=UPI003896ED7D
MPPVRLHDLRHCAATLSLAAGIHMKKIQTLLGHSSYSLTADTYTSVLPQFERAEADAALAVVPRAESPEKAQTDPELAGGARRPRRRDRGARCSRREGRLTARSQKVPSTQEKGPPL